MAVRRWTLGLVAALGCPALALAQAVVTSAAPEKVAVSVYRAPGRPAGQAMNLRWLAGYALITEERTVDLPAGRATVRFEGVAGGMMPESVIVRGLPAKVREKNLDADLLTPRSLYAHTLGRPVTLRRAHPKTGEVTEEPAIIRSSPEGGVILETRAGFEAANCGPLADSLSYSHAPTGLSPRPTLSIETEAPAPVRATLSLSYLASGFDWQTNYVVKMDPHAQRAELSAWVTLASGDPTSFPDATLAVVAGAVNREERTQRRQMSPQHIVFQCYFTAIPLPAAPPVPVRVEEGMLSEVIVTAYRRKDQLQDAAAPVTAAHEDLGDLKLYRVPFNSTVAANAQKQVAMIAPRKVKLAPVYVSDLYPGAEGDLAVGLELHGRNRKEDGLGLPLPAGRVAVLEQADQADLLIGEGDLPDKAIDQAYEIKVAQATQVTATIRQVGKSGRVRSFAVEVTNANPWPVTFEAPIYISSEQQVAAASDRLATKNARPLWRTRVQAHGKARLRFSVAQPE